MISKAEYDVLMMLNSSPEIDEQKYFNELMSILKDKLISRVLNNVLFCSQYFITPLGHRAIEEYEVAQRKISIDDDTLKTAREANDIAKDANRIAEKANKKSNRANWIAGITALLALGSLITAIIAICR